MKRIITTPDGQEQKVVVFADTDVLVSSGEHTGESVQSALSSFNRRIQKLESNTKWLYKYGGLGSGGSGSGSGDGGFKAVVMDIASRQQLMPIPIENKLNYKSPGKQTFGVTIYKGGGASYKISWEYTTKSGLMSDYTIASPDTDYSATITTNFSINVDAFNIKIQSMDDPDSTPIQYTSRVVVQAYEFKAYYVQYNEGTEDYTKYEPLNENIFIGNLVPTIGQQKGLKIAFECNVNVDLNSAYYEYTNWQGTRSTVQCENVNSLGNYPNEIQSNRSKTIYLDLVDDDILEYLGNYNNAALKQFYITIKVKASGKSEDDIITIRLSDTLIPPNLYLKVAATTGLLYDKQPTTKQVYQYNASSLAWIEHTKKQDEYAIPAIGHTSKGYVLEAVKGIVIVENGVHYTAQTNQWLELNDYTGDAIETIAHGNNCYTIEASDGTLIEQCIWEHPERYTAGNRISVKLTPYNGALDITKKIFDFQLSIDGWIVDPSLIENVSKLTEQIQKTINPLIEDNGRDWHCLNFKITYNTSDGRTQTYDKNYYIGVVAPISFTWYSNDVEVKTYSSYFRQGQNSSGLRDAQTGKIVTGLEQIDQNINSQPRTFVFETNSEISSKIDQYDQFFSIGIQYSAINSDSTPIAVINSAVKNSDGSISDGNKISINADSIQFISTDGTSQKIDFDINKEQTISKETEDTSKFHLISILTYLEQQPIGEQRDTRSILVFVDGVLNCAFDKFYSIPYFNSVTLYPGNYYVNLIECAAIQHVNDTQVFSLLGPSQYYYAYDEGILNHQVVDRDQYAKKIALFNALSKAKEDIDNFVYFDDASGINDIAANVEMPVLMFNYNDKDRQGVQPDEDDYLKKEMSKSYEDNSSLIHPYPVTIDWSNGLDSLNTVLAPDSDAPQSFNIQFQGSSTLGYRCKNFELECNNNAGQYTVFTPNFKRDNFESFLPEHSFTLKADVVDSSHTNNNAMGHFINKIMTPFAGATNDQPENLRNYIKTCLTGFPILLFLHTTSLGTTEDINRYYFLGIYNFNLGRKSYFNLGYSSLKAFTLDQTDTSKIFLKDGFNIYTLTNVEQHAVKPEIRVAEIQRNEPYYDFSQYDSSVLFGLNSGDKERMFDDFVDGSPEETIKTDIQNFVQKIAYGGGYVFNELKKNFSVSESDSRYGYANAYAEIDETTQQSKNRVPNFKYQLSATIVGSEKQYVFNSKPIEDAKLENLRNAIEQYTTETDDTNIPAVNYTSLVEYYAICMAFGLVDSVQKNLNIKSWNSGKTFYLAFYDMDTCLGINNDGGKINYYAFSDYWPTNSSEGEIQPSIVQYDFSPKNAVSETQHLSFYDTPSSYLFAIAKYAYTIYSKQLSDCIENVARSPNSIWALWRNGNPQLDLTGDWRGKGCLCNAKYFINKFYKSHLDSVPTPAFTLNYIYKYLVYGVKNAQGKYDKFDDKNFPKFWGRKIAYTENWLTSRLHILDAYFNILGINDILPNQDSKDGYVVPIPASGYNQYQYDPTNDDIYVARDIFSSQAAGNRYATSINTTMKALPYTPIIPRSGGASKGKYITPAESNVPFQLNIDVTNTDVVLGGTVGITDVDSIDKFIVGTGNNSLYINSQYLTSIIGTSNSRPCQTWNLSCPMANIVKLNNNNYAGDIEFDSTYKNLQTIDISQTKLGLKIDGVPVQSLSAVNMLHPASITVMNLPMSSLTDVYLGGSFNKINMPTWKKDIALPDKSLGIDSFECADLTLTNREFADSSISIVNNSSLTSVSLYNFSNIYISGCDHLKNVTINTQDEYKDKDGNAYQLKSLKIYHYVGYVNDFKVNSSNSNEIDLTNFPLLSTLVLNNVVSRSVLFNGNSTVHLPYQALYNCDYLSGLVPGYDETTKKYTTFVIDGNAVFAQCPHFSLSSIRTGHGVLSVSSTLSSLANMFNIASNGITYSQGIDTTDLGFFLSACQPISNNITAVDGMCGWQERLSYGLSELSTDIKNARCSNIALNFPNCSNATGAYLGTNIKAFNKYMLSAFGSNVNTVNINSIFGSQISATTDFLYYVVHKLNSFSPWYSGTGSSWHSVFTFVDNKGKMLNTVALSSIFNFTTANKYPTNLTSLNSLNVNSKQYVDVAGMFSNFDRWTRASSQGLEINLFGSSNDQNTTNSLLNVVVDDEDNNPFETFLQNVKIKAMNNSFKNVKFFKKPEGSSSYEDCTSSTWIDIGKFINWNNIANATNLFYNEHFKPSLNFNKKIAYSKTMVDAGISAFSFVDVWDKIASNNSLTGMSYVFSNARLLVGEEYCSTDDIYNNADQTKKYSNGIVHLNSYRYREDAESRVNTSLSSISYLFNNMRLVPRLTDDTQQYQYQYATFTSDFFKYFKNIVNARNAFEGLYLANTLPYNFFNKRNDQPSRSTVYILSGDDNNSTVVSASLLSSSYRHDLNDLRYCFSNVKFKEHIGFCLSAEYNKELSNALSIDNKIVVVYGSTSSVVDVDTYYKTRFNAEHKIYPIAFQHATELCDCYVHTDYASVCKISDVEINNFEIPSILNNVRDKLFVAPDILYGVKNNSSLIEGMFANTIDSLPSFSYNHGGQGSRISVVGQENDLTFTGALPKSMFKYASSIAFSNAFQNINVLPVSVASYISASSYPSQSETPIEISDTYECYAFVPSNFTQRTDLDNSFNFRIFIPAYTHTSPDLSSRIVEYYVLLNNSIPKTTTSLANALPSRGNALLYAARLGNEFGDNDWPCYRYNVSSLNTHYHVVGNLEYSQNDGLNELTAVSDGFKPTEFPYMKYDNLAVDHLTRMLNGHIVHGDATVSQINVNSKPMITLPINGQINKCLSLPFSTINAALSFKKIIDKRTYFEGSTYAFRYISKSSCGSGVPNTDILVRDYKHGCIEFID